MVTRKSPIVVLDSGLGGLTVVRALREALPNEDLVYFGDTARVPYGQKSATTVTNFVRQIITYLLPHNPKHVVIACNTATALALDAVRGEFSVPITGVIEPGSAAAAMAVGNRSGPVVGIIATEQTVRSRAYEAAITRRTSNARIVAKATPLLVHLIEEGFAADDPIVREHLHRYLQSLIAENIDVLVLGCTHYPIFRGIIQDVVGSGVRVVDSAQQCALDVAENLAERQLLNHARDGALSCFVTDHLPRFADMASKFLGFNIELPTLVSTDELHRITSPQDYAAV